MRLLDDATADDADPVLDVAIAHALLAQASRGERGETIRLYRPKHPTLAFGRSDTRRAGFPAAVRAGRASGFTPLVRPPGGRAVAYTREAVALDHLCPDGDPGRRMRRRFAEYGELLAQLLRGFGVDARVGEVPGEYCPGAYSVNARGTTKLIGTAQRIVRNAWLFSAVVIVDGTTELKPLLHNTYRLLDLPFDEHSVGSLRDEIGTIDRDAVAAAIRTACAGDAVAEQLDQTTLDEATALRREHLL